MERVAFILVHSDERISCMLNPQSLTLRRTAGIHSRSSLGGAFVSTELSDNPILHTGGGITELELDLLFDVHISGSTIHSEDVRDLTSPFWEMAENLISSEGRQIPPQIRFVWGKSWNIPGVVLQVAERFDKFTRGGAPKRSWMRLRILRVMEDILLKGSPRFRHKNVLIPEKRQDLSHTETTNYTLSSHDRLDNLATRFYGNASYWRLLASYNSIDDPFNLKPGETIEIIPVNILKETN
ncbi:hypothetical protein QA601_03350 [Chitinispirillales bacterium ANBcel5]|uniref:CIS tube protein n=1 Tax=Cellulosispirillum alkaliphilum TaxID=3039283 RepID=UPI002A58247B|nr:hypothetical protein [Chitinispirillales bacterium ANBcel5]